MDARAAVVAEALSWRGTPFHDRAGLKGVGVDCIHLVIRVYAAVGLIEDFDPPPYSPQWFQHRDEPVMLQGLEQYCHRVGLGRPADIAVYNFGRHAAHAALIVDQDTIVHAYKPVGHVLTQPRSLHEGRIHAYYALDALR